MQLQNHKGKIIVAGVGLLVGIGYALSPWKYRGGKWAKAEKKEKKEKKDEKTAEAKQA